MPVQTTAFLVVILSPPGIKKSVHVSLYMPTHSKDSEFVSDMADLRKCLDDVSTSIPNPVVYIRGDSNVNKNNTARVTLLQQLIRDFSLIRVDTGHNTYHHFVGNGLYDSNIDILLHTDGDNICETISEIMCKDDHPAILSHHDILISSCTIPGATLVQPGHHESVAPRLQHSRMKIDWSDEGQAEYCQLVAPYLRQARETWLDPSSPLCMSILLSITSSVLLKCATMTNKHRISGDKAVSRSAKIPKAIRLANNKMCKAHKIYKKCKDAYSSAIARDIFRNSKKNYQRIVRKYRVSASLQRYQRLDQIFSDQKAAYAYIRSCRKSPPKSIEELEVGEKVYTGAAVCDGFYESMTALKNCDVESLKCDPSLSTKFINYDMIRKLCQDQPPIPPISLKDSSRILKSLKKKATDFYSITSLHYLHAGEEGHLHYNFLLNALISDVNNSKIEELNIAHGNILYKGHRKKKTLDRSYRTISSCPFLAKSIDFYLRDLYSDCWDSKQATTQFQGQGSDHELASLLVTEVLQYSMNVSNKPLYVLTLDAQSAFYRCLRQILCEELYKAGVDRSAICFMDNRLASKRTVYEWDRVMMGPAEDTTGFEQGGINSSDYYKLYNNEQLITAQSSLLGADIGSSVISAVGQADDVLLMSNDIYNLHLLVMMTEEYCKKFRVKLEPKKTRLLGYCTGYSELCVKLAIRANPITIDGIQVAFADEAEHVGVIRNTKGNMPNILHRISEHKKSLGAVLSTGMARGHRGSPAAALRVHQLHCTPVLFSGLASLVLNKAEIAIIANHYQRTIQNLQRLHPKTPRSIVFFLAGSVPAEAILHKRQLSLFSMICNLPQSPLNHHGRYVLTTLPPSSSSWFLQLRDICQQYCLPHPLTLMEKPYPKQVFKKLVKEKVTEFWHGILAAECVSLSSLRFINPYYASLLRPHPMWTSTAGNSYECSKSTILARMASGRYRTEMLCRFWTTNRSGYCLAETCQAVQGDIVHLLIVCPALKHTRQRLHSMWCNKTLSCPPLHSLILKILGSTPDAQVRFILDSRACPDIILLKQVYGQEIENMVQYLTRTWAFAIHRHKMRLLGRWPETATQQRHGQDLIDNIDRLNNCPPTTENCDTTDENNDSPNYDNTSVLAGRFCQDPAIAAPDSVSFACTNSSSQPDQPLVPAVVPASGSHIVYHNTVSSAVAKDGDQLGRGGGHVAAGCGGGAGASYGQQAFKFS